MPDQPSTSQAPVAAETTDNPESGVQPSADQTSTATKTSDNAEAEPKRMSYEDAAAILDQASKSAKNRVIDDDSLEDPEEVDPLSEPEEADPLDIGDLDEVLPDETTETQAEEETPESTEEATPTAEEPETPAAEEEHETDPDGMPKRIRLNLEQLNARDRAVILHSRKTSKSLRDAEIELFGDVQTPATAKTTEPAKVEPSEPEETPEQILTELETLRADRRKAAEAFDAKTQVETTEKIEAAMERLGEAKARQAAQQNAYKSAFQESKGRAEQAYPDAFKPGNPLHDAIVADKARLEQVNPAFFNDPEWAETLVYKHAGKLSIKAAAKVDPKHEAPAVTPKAKAKVIPAKPARPVPGPAPGGTPAESQTTEQQIRTQIADARAKGDIEALDRLVKQLQKAA